MTAPAEPATPPTADVEHILACSEFVASALARDPTLLADLTGRGGLVRRRDSGGEASWPDGASPDLGLDEPAFQSWLRRWRRREMVRIAWRDLAGTAALPETLEDLSAFADDAIGLAYAHAWRSTTALGC